MTRTLAVAVLFATPAVAAPPAAEDARVVYALGLTMAEQLGPFGFSSAEIEHLITGLRDGTAKTEHGFDLKVYGPKIGELARARAAKAAVVTKAAGKVFRDKAAKAEGAQQTESGLVVVPQQVGGGANPTLEDTVKVHYHGTLVDGTVFDSSVERGEPVTFQLKGVVPCWREGVPLIKAGGKARLICPPELAYGDKGAGPKIGPGATLIFDVELLEVTPAGK